MAGSGVCTVYVAQAMGIFFGLKNRSFLWGGAMPKIWLQKGGQPKNVVCKGGGYQKNCL